MKELKRMLADEDFEGARARLRALARAAERSSELTRLHKPLARLLAAAPDPSAKRLRIALLGNATTETIEGPLAVALFEAGFEVEVHRAPYDSVAFELMNPDSATRRFAPDLAIVVQSPANLPPPPGVAATDAEADAAAEQLVGEWLAAFAALHDGTGAEVVVDNLHPPAVRPHGHLEAKLPGSGRSQVDRVNRALAARAPAYVHVHDVATLAAHEGVGRWFEPRFWHHAKQPVSFACLPAYARSLARVVGAIYGATAKCLVLDLDNTLWGGVVGDDGWDGVAIGQGDPVGEAHLAIQAYALALKQRGIMLAVCSKNFEDKAKEPFERREDMLLRLDDLVAFKANWDPKPGNLQAIARELNIGLDALVFLDDNPAEREIVRQMTPQVKVVEVGDDAAEYVGALDATRWFEVVRLSKDDLSRTEQYKANAERKAALESTAGDYEGYLRTLEQVAEVRPFAGPHLDRITQLSNKSNQFNLTTRRVSRSEVETEMADPDRITAYVKLRDRFGDNGLICVFSARRAGEAVAIDQWLMSCRVLNRGVEKMLTNVIAERARAAGARYLDGVYLPTPKNVLVEDHYRKLGFEAQAAMPEDPEGATRWRLDLERFDPFEVAIALTEDD